MGVDFSIVPTSGAPLISKVSWPHEKIDLLISLAGLQKCQQVPKIDPYRDQRIDYRDVKTWIEELRAIRCLYLDHRLEDLLRRNPRRTQAARVAAQTYLDGLSETDSFLRLIDATSALLVAAQNVSGTVKITGD